MPRIHVKSAAQQKVSCCLPTGTRLHEEDTTKEEEEDTKKKEQEEGKKENYLLRVMHCSYIHFPLRDYPSAAI